jgi:hypothetical protein
MVDFILTGSEVLTALVITSNIISDITLSSPFKVNRGFGGTYRPDLQGRRISRARPQRERRCQAGLSFNS